MWPLADGMWTWVDWTETPWERTDYHTLPSSLRDQDGQKVLWDQGASRSLLARLWVKKVTCHRMGTISHYSRRSCRPAPQQLWLCYKHLRMLVRIFHDLTFFHDLTHTSLFFLLYALSALILETIPYPFTALWVSGAQFNNSMVLQSGLCAGGSGKHVQRCLWASKQHTGSHTSQESSFPRFPNIKIE